MAAWRLGCFLPALPFSAWSQEELPFAPKVLTTLGTLQGRRLPSFEANLIDAFLGVPYAEPVGSEGCPRFTPAQPKKPWDGILKAENFGSSCVQGLNDDGSLDGAEDCLFLNLYAPSRMKGQKRPVVFWIHGGGFTFGSGDIYTGAAVAAEYDVVHVSINYRLGVLGFLQHKDLAMESGSEGALGGMNGIRDQILALKWVKENIEAFGGDPEQITVMGESAGGQSVCILTASAAAQGLFHRSIIQSGPCVADSGDYLGWGPGSSETGLAAGQNFLADMNLATLQQLRDAPIAHLFAANLIYGERADGGTPPIYYIDGYIHASHPQERWKNGQLNSNQILVGINSADGLMGWPFASFGDTNKTMSREQARAVASLAFGEAAADAVLSHYSGRGRWDAALYAAYRDAGLSCDVRRMADWAHQANKTVYAYFIGSPLKEGGLDNIGDFPTGYFPHALEIVAIFDPLGKISWVPTFMHQTVGQSARNYWMSFASAGEPTDKTALGGHGLEWPKFEGSGDWMQPYLFLGPKIEVNGSPGDQLAVPTAADCEFWDNLKRTDESTGNFLHV